MEDINNWQLKFEPCYYSNRFLNQLTFLNTLVNFPVDVQEIKKAIYYARKYHDGQKRKSGEPYYSHPIEVGYILAEYAAKEDEKYFRTDLLVTSVLHDCIEDTTLTESMIATIFGKVVANQVESLTRIKLDGKISAAEIVDLLFLKHDKDVLHVKLFDRLHNMRTIDAMSPNKTKKILDETLNNFVPLAMYLEIPKIEYELSKLCLSLCNTSSLINHIFVEDNYLLLSLGFQNGLNQMQNQ